MESWIFFAASFSSWYRALRRILLESRFEVEMSLALTRFSKNLRLFAVRYYWPLGRRRKNIFFHSVSPSRLVSDWIKLKASMAAETSLPHDKVAAESARGAALKFVNRMYRYISGALLVTLILSSQSAITRLLPTWLIVVAESVLLLYAVSRVIEVFLAFLFDALRIARGEDPTSDLTKEGRLKLALWSYVSVVMDFALLFWLLKSGMNSPFTAPTQSVYFSVISIATIGYGDYFPTRWYTQLCVMSEVACGLILLVISLSIYIGEQKGTAENGKPQKIDSFVIGAGAFVSGARTESQDIRKLCCWIITAYLLLSALSFTAISALHDPPQPSTVPMTSATIGPIELPGSGVTEEGWILCRGSGGGPFCGGEILSTATTDPVYPKIRN